jgi:hypothetical protein
MLRRTDFVRPSSSVCVSQDLRAVMIEAVLSVGSPIQPVSFPGVVTMKRKAEWFVAVVIPKQKGFLIRSR